MQSDEDDVLGVGGEERGNDEQVPMDEGSDDEELEEGEPHAPEHFPDALREIALILFHNRYHRPQTHESLMQGLFGAEEEEAREEEMRPVRDVIRETPRALFVPPEAALFANNDMPLDLHPYGLATNLSAPHIYPRVMQLLRIQPGLKVDSLFRETGSHRALQVLDVGCGTGYLSTMCWQLGAEVEGWDIDEKVLVFARQVAARKGFPVR